MSDKKCITGVCYCGLGPLCPEQGSTFKVWIELEEETPDGDYRSIPIDGFASSAVFDTEAEAQEFAGKLNELAEKALEVGAIPAMLAAREMLEALHGVDVLYAEMGKALPLIANTRGFDIVQAAVLAARAAIAKAEGRGL